MSKQAIWPGSPGPLPYTPGILAGGFVYVSGQVPLDPATRAIVEGDFEERVRQCIRNVESVLKAVHASMNDVVKVTVFLTDMSMFARMNAVYAEYWGDPKPARSCVQVAGLPMGVDVEIEAIARID